MAFSKGIFLIMQNHCAKNTYIDPNGKQGNFSTYSSWQPLQRNNVHLPHIQGFEHKQHQQA